jgi:hypothetical protein
VKKLVVMVVISIGLALPATGQSDQMTAITKILNARSLWGKDFPAAIASLPTWKRFDEGTVVITRNQILGGTPYKTAEPLQALRGAVRESMFKSVQPTPAFESLLSAHLKGPSSLDTEVVTFADDTSQRLAMLGPSYQFLPEKLSTKQVEEVAGRPEKVTTEVIQTEGERRPVTLTLRSYAGGAIVYAESDWAPTPGLVDRVILNVSTVTATAFKAER